MDKAQESTHTKGKTVGESHIQLKKNNLQWVFFPQLHNGSLVMFGDSCIFLLGNHVLAWISIVGVKKLPIFLHKTIATVETTSFATPTLDSPPLVSMYYLPYKNGEVKKIVLY